VAAVVCLALGAGPARAATDVESLKALHEKVLRAHRAGDVEILFEDEGAGYVVANRGEVTRPTREERRSWLGPYLRSTTFEEYADVTEPVVKVSGDGTLGCTQAATGGEKRPLAFESAWIELYEKRDGRWYRVGNVSNFKP
jgi:hypothetical protein